MVAKARGAFFLRQTAAPGEVFPWENGRFFTFSGNNDAGPPESPIVRTKTLHLESEPHFLSLCHSILKTTRSKDIQMKRDWFTGAGSRVSWEVLLLSSLSFAACDSKPEEAGSAEATETTEGNIRDDIREYIQEEFAAGSDELKAVQQYAASKQAELDVADEKAAALAAVRAAFRSQSCMNYVLGFERAHEMVKELRARLLSTAERTEAYLRIEKHLGGETFMLPPSNNLAATCDFTLQRAYDE